MDKKARGVSPWSLNGSRAQLSVDRLSAEVDIAHPHQGLYAISLDELKITAELLCVYRSADMSRGQVAATGGKTDWPLSVADAYVRDSDLVVSYAPTGDWPFSPQVYWRANTLNDVHAVIGSLSLLVSVQTHLLDTWPRIGVRSGLACGEMLRIKSNDGRLQSVEPIKESGGLSGPENSSCIVCRLDNAPLSYIEIMPDSDYWAVKPRKLETTSGDVEWELFSDFLEKGVIWRARLYSAFVPRENDLEIAAACCDTVLRSALPLTT
jgi:hypothetical protein